MAFAIATTGTIVQSTLERLAAGLIRMTENSARAREVNALNALSDADLAARGTTRMAEIQKIVGPGRFF